MRKNKISAINSYAAYKLYKTKWMKTGVVLLTGLIILFAAFSTGRLQTDLDAFILENNLNIWGSNKIGTSQDVILPQDKICYDFYTVPKETKGIYVPSKKLNEIGDYIRLAKETDINCFVIDVKDDNGRLTFDTDNPLLVEKGIVPLHPPITDIDDILCKLNEAGIYPIARVVAFKDNVYTKTNPQQAIRQLDGDVYVTKGGDRWLNPYDRENWDYILEICEEAYNRGFKEVQFDYVRFHESMDEETVIFDGEESKTEIITEFIKYMSAHLHKKGMKVSADVFGAVVLSDIDAEIVGQDFVEMSKYLDYISPMIYPSHYANGTFGIEYPHIDVYEIILKTMERAQKKLDEASIDTVQIRPWLQDFTLSYKEPYLEYGPEQIKAQIQGAYDAGTSNWAFWNASGKYTKEGMKGQ